jgi:hypothetical protein
MITDRRFGERQMKIYPWGKLPACRFLNSRRLEAYATVRNELPRALLPRGIGE